MNLLLDTHILLWFIADHPSLPAAWAAVIRDPANAVFVSVVSIWEATIKYELGRLPLPDHPARYLTGFRIASRFAALGIDEGTVASLAGLPPVHRDPFDRILMAQAIQHDLTVVTVDADIRAYPVKLLPP